MSEGGGLLGAPLDDPAIAECFSPTSVIQSFIDVEVALAEAATRAGIVPPGVSAALQRVARVERFDVSAIAGGAAVDGNLAIPFVRQLMAFVEADERTVAPYVHWGATSQDLLDSALVSCLRRSVPLITAHVRRSEGVAERLARTYVDAVMPGRTWLQHAPPVTFGLKAAGWLSALHRRRQALTAAVDDASVSQLGGASGTLAAFGDRGLLVSRHFAELLGLREPELPWHTHRDRVATVATALGLLCGVTGKIGRDLVLLAQTEVGEVQDLRGGGSSTMPQKRNPVSATVAASAAVRAPGLVGTMLAAMPQEHERGPAGWQAEWTALPALVGLSGGAARAIADALESASVDVDRMARNLELGGGASMAEAVSLALAPHIGRRAAHSLVADAVRGAAQSGVSLRETLARDPQIVQHVSPPRLDGLLDPRAYLGQARALVERALAAYAEGRDAV